ncbi:MAG: hypothetical protein AAGF12_00770 [Myxococcota bacterium]
MFELTVLFAVLAIVSGVFEAWLARVRPNLLARFAFVPVPGGRTIPLSEASRNQLEAGGKPAHYRASARGDVALEKLQYPDRFETAELIFIPPGNAGPAAVVSKVREVTRVRFATITRIDVRARGGSLEVSARYLPQPLLQVFCFLTAAGFGLATVGLPVWVLLPIAVLTLAIQPFINRRIAKRTTDTVLDRIEEQVSDRSEDEDPAEEVLGSERVPRARVEEDVESEAEVLVGHEVGQTTRAK